MVETAMNDDFSQLVTNYFKNDYRERGKIKWQGYFLSDHTALLNSDNEKRHQVTERLPRMSLGDIKQSLDDAALSYSYVIVQLDQQSKDGQMADNIIGTVNGYSDRGVVVNQQHILFETIRAVRIQ
ncbi:hypothetical protein [Leuconostoc citreum]|uniref:hypothetical protein n=1 Tax=Leuconostoc citreum TaxID=33964 RepID=UPI0032E011A4